MKITTPAWCASQRVAWAILIVALAFAAFVRGRLAAFPLERDEGEYAYAGQLLLQGIPPYCLAYNMKLPGTYLAYAGVMAVFGETSTGIHLGLLVVNLATIGLVFLLARELFDPLTAAVAAASFAVASTSSTVLGLAAHATHFVTLFGVAGVWVLWRALRSDKQWPFFAAGLLLGLAFLMKQQGVFLACFGGLATLLSSLGRRPFLSPRHAVRCLIYAAGAILPLAATCLWLWWAGVFEKFWFWAVEYARAYATELSLPMAWEVFWPSIRLAIGVNWPIWALALVGAIGLALSKDVPGRRLFVFGFLLFSFLCVCPGFYFRDHYFIVLLPCIAILAGRGAVALAGLFAWPALGRFFAPRPRSSPSRPSERGKAKTAAKTASDSGITARRWPTGLTAAMVAAAIALPVWQERHYYFYWSPLQACRVVYGIDAFMECALVGDYIKKHSFADDRVAVLGSEPELYFYARRISATGYIYMYPLVEAQPFARKMQEEMIREIESAKPEFLLCVNVHNSWSARPDSDPSLIQNWLIRYVAAGYHPVGLLDIFSDRPTECKWDAQAADARPRSQSYVWLFRRNR